MYINTNVAAINTQRHVYQTNLDLDRSLERLSSGLRINSAADDASGLAIADKMNAQRTGISTAVRNTQDASALFKIADGALGQAGKMLARMEELCVRAANKTLTASDRAVISAEISELLNQIDTISGQTEYNTIKLLNGNLDVVASLVATNGIAGTIKILDAPKTVQSATNLSFSISTVGSAAYASSNGVPVVGNIGISGAITINNVDVNILSTDTVETVIAKINAQNSKTNVVAVSDSTNTNIALISGTLDTDASNVIKAIAGSTVANGSAIGYVKTGTSATISLGGTQNIWSNLGFVTTVATGFYNASGTNATATLSGVGFIVDSQNYGSGHVLEMKNSGSRGYGVKVGIDMFNGAFGAFILTRQAAIGNSVNHLSSTTDTANVSFDTSRMLRVQVGANYNQALNYNIKSVDTNSIGVGASSKFGALNQISVDTAEEANLSLKVIQKAIIDVADARSSLGAILNRLDYTDKTLQVQRENMASAESKIRDADIALEMTTFTRQQILMQAGTSMLAQANAKPQNILSLLKG